MKRIVQVFIVFLAVVIIPHNFYAQAVIADHTIVDDYDIIPQQYIDSVKKMWVTVPGESHSSGYRKGLQFLEDEDARFQVNVVESGTPEGYTDQNLRFSRATWGMLEANSGWQYTYGEEDWFTSTMAVDRTKAGLVYANENGFELAATGFGWCWDMSWNNAPGGTVDPVHQTRWAGTTSGGPQGNMIWGLDSNDEVLTGNSVCMDTYIQATEEYIELCELNNYKTIVFFTSGPIDATYYNTGERGFQRYLKSEYIRDYVGARGDGYLFDYADILSWNNSGEQHNISWTDHGGTLQSFEYIHPDNMIDLDGSYGEDGDHIGQIGTIRLAKAMWWMLARMAGWNGLPEGADSEAPSVPAGLGASVVDENSVNISWEASSDNVGVAGYRLYRDGELLHSVSITEYSDTGLNGELTYSYSVSSYDAAGNTSAISDPLLVNTYDTLGISLLDLSFEEGYNWMSINVTVGDNSIASVFPGLNSDGDYLKNQVSSSTYYDGYGWFGTLTQLNSNDAYLLKIGASQDVLIKGDLVDQSTHPIELQTGWNWIGYLPEEAMLIEDALSSYSFNELDYIKSQTSSATYYDGTGWFGSLTELSPGTGYMLKVASSGSLLYPVQSSKSMLPDFDVEQVKKGRYHLNEHEFEYNLSGSFKVYIDGVKSSSSEDVLYAFVGDECRGYCTGLFFEPGNELIFPLMIYSNMSQGEDITFKFYNAKDDKMFSCEESIVFLKDSIVANALDAMVLHVNLTEVLTDSEMVESFMCYPNPFDEDIVISFKTRFDSQLSIEILDVVGRLVDSIDDIELYSGNNHINYNCETLKPGVYYVRMLSRNGQYLAKIIKK